jgi:hypothetical protein
MSACDILSGKRPSHTLAAQAVVSWGFSELFGGTIDFQVAHAVANGGFNTPSTAISGSISVWFRTDGQLQRNWLDR